MAKLERVINEDFYSLKNRIYNGIMEGSVSASLEDSSEFTKDGICCSLQVFERYSYMGGNRLSLSVALFGPQQGPIHLSAITAGGSQAMFFKVNTFGEEAFLEALEAIL